MTAAAADVTEHLAVERLLRVVRERTGFDLTGYRMDGLVRRAGQRARAVGLHDDIAAYTDRVAVDPTEAVQLLDHLLVQVSGWFRDAHVWATLRETVLPSLSGPGRDRPVRAWVAGCGQGQEVYSLAACLEEARTSGHLPSWWVLATDVDTDALRLLAGARYPRSAVPAVVDPVLAPHLLHEGSHYRVAHALTSSVGVGRHDVRAAPPEDAATPFDLVVCRNLLMYLDDAMQVQVLDGLIAALRPGGVLVLGQAELPIDRRDALVPVDLGARAYRLIGSPLPLA